MQATIKAPFPYFGGKSKVAAEIWSRLGDVPNYVEPFFGSGAVLLARPHAPKVETINDFDGLLANFWRAVKAEPEAVASYADNPVNENDLHARHAWLVGKKESLQARLEGDPDFYDVKAAGWWVWGLCTWIGSGWCSGRGPWKVVNDEDGVPILARVGSEAEEEPEEEEIEGTKRQLPHLARHGRGVNRQVVHLRNPGMGVNRQVVHLSGPGQGVNRSLVNLSTDKGVNRKMVEVGSSRGVHRPGDGIYDLFAALAARLRRTRVCCGDWSRVCGPTPTTGNGLTGVLLDPPYEEYAHLYRADGIRSDEGSVSAKVREWALEHGDDPMMRIALCGYEGEHPMPDSWECLAWKAAGGYGSQSQQHDNPNARRERVWFSPHCIKVGVKPQQFSLLEMFES